MTSPYDAIFVLVCGLVIGFGAGIETGSLLWEPPPPSRSSHIVVPATMPLSPLPQSPPQAPTTPLTPTFTFALDPQGFCVRTSLHSAQEAHLRVVPSC